MTTTTIFHRDAVSDALYATLVHIGLTPYPDPLPLRYKGGIDTADHWQRVYHAQANALASEAGHGANAEGVAYRVLAQAKAHQESKGVTPPPDCEEFFGARLLDANAEIEERISYERANPDDSEW